MNFASKLAAVVGVSLPVLFGGVASAAPAEANAEDDPIMVLISQMVVSGNEASGNADRNQ
jgi:hypothetical protein